MGATRLKDLLGACAAVTAALIVAVPALANCDPADLMPGCNDDDLTQCCDGCDHYELAVAVVHCCESTNVYSCSNGTCEENDNCLPSQDCIDCDDEEE